jgi:transposase-like protein
MTTINTKSENSAVNDPEVTLRPVRRTFTAAYKQAILEECEMCASGGIGMILRREGLYGSHLTQWRKQRIERGTAGLEPRRRGPRPQPDRVEMTQLRRENERLQMRLQQAEAIIDVQKKVSQLLGLIASPTDEPK